MTLCQDQQEFSKYNHMITSLFDLLCKVGHLYLASQTILKKHTGQHRARAQENVPTQTVPESTQIKSIRPLRITSRRQREPMAVIARRENAHTEAVEWLDEDELICLQLSFQETMMVKD